MLSCPIIDGSDFRASEIAEDSRNKSLFFSHNSWLVYDRLQWKRDVAKTSLNLPVKFLYRSLWAQISKKKCSKFAFQKKTKKNIPWQMLGQDLPQKNSAKCEFEAARFRVLDRHRSTKPTTAPCNLVGARSLGA